MTYCFCGCGTRVANPRLVVTNSNGWELSEELAQWTKMQILWSRSSLDLSDQFKKNIADGHHCWREMVTAIHTGERADKDIETHAVVWRKHAKKDRRKLRRRFRKDGMPDPFELPDMEAAELTAWITEGIEPSWATELVDAAAMEEDLDESEDSVAFGLLSAALEEMKGGWWEWDLPAGEALVEAADELTDFREEYNLVLDAAALGYWVRTVERDVTGEVNVFDPDYIEGLQRHFEKDKVEAIRTTMVQTADLLPGAFAQGPDVLEEVIDLASSVLEERAKQLLAEHDEFDDDAEITPVLREFFFKMGYGLATTVDAIGIPGTRERQS